MSILLWLLEQVYHLFELLSLDLIFLVLLMFDLSMYGQNEDLDYLVLIYYP